MDEMYSYGLANNSVYSYIFMAPEMGKVYEPASVAFENYLTVQKEHRFDFINVWKKNAGDVHPPVYYAFIHLISSLFPNTFSTWYAAIVNIIFALMTFFIMRRILSCYMEDKYAGIFSLGWVLSAGILNITAFYRMYICVGFWIVFLLYISILRFKDKLQEKQFSLLLCIGTVAGTLTQYFMAFYLIGFCLVWFVYFIKTKQYIRLRNFLLSMSISVLVVIGVFPWAIKHVLKSGRGNEVTAGLSKIVDLERFSIFADYINEAVLGGVGILIFLLTLYLLMLMIAKKRTSNIVDLGHYLILVPTVVYFILVAKSAPFEAERYIVPIYPVSYIAAALLFYSVGKNIKKKTAVAIVAVLLIIVNGWRICDWEYLYKGKNEKLKEFQNNHTDKACVFICENEGDCWPIQGCYLEAMNYATLEVITTDMIENNNFNSDLENAVIFVSSSVNVNELIDVLRTYANIQQLDYIVREDFFSVYTTQ